MRTVNPMTILRTALFVLLAAAIVAGAGETARTYQHGTITGWSTKYYPSGFSGKHKFFELKGDGMVYQIDDCGSFQAGQFTAGQTVDYRVDEADPNDKRIYIRRDDGKEYKCKMDGARASAAPSSPAPSAKPQ
jgi:hypothetical protein